jgi:hypothetical protein
MATVDQLAYQFGTDPSVIRGELAPLAAEWSHANTSAVIDEAGQVSQAAEAALVTRLGR